MFDLDAYFTRIAYTGPRTPDLATLRAVHTAHLAAIPFEGLDPFLDRPVRLDMDPLADKLIGHHRGGYCFEQNTLFKAVLEALGFEVTAYQARVRWMVPAERQTPRSHMFLKVILAGEPWLADVGFGAHLIAGPLRMEPGLEQQTPLATLRLVEEGTNATLQSKLGERWQDVYRFADDPAVPADFEMANWFHSTSPVSHFRANLLMERLLPDRRVMLLNRELTKRWPDGSAETVTIGSAVELGRVLEGEFGVTAPVAVEEVWTKLSIK